MVLPLILQVGSTFGDPVVLPPFSVFYLGKRWHFLLIFWCDVSL